MLLEHIEHIEEWNREMKEINQTCPGSIGRREKLATLSGESRELSREGAVGHSALKAG